LDTLLQISFVSIEVVWQNRVMRPRDKVFTNRAECSYLRWTDIGAISTHIETATLTA
jgi:hypothetical protein